MSFLLWVERKENQGKVFIGGSFCRSPACARLSHVLFRLKQNVRNFQQLVVMWLGAHWLAEFGRADGKFCRYRCPRSIRYDFEPNTSPYRPPPFSQWVHTICQHQCLPHAKQFSSIYITSTRNFPRTLHEAMFDLMSSNWRITCSTVKRVLYFQKAACPGWMSAAVRGSERSSTS